MEDVGSNPAPHHHLASGHLLPTSQVGTRTGQSNEMLVRIQEPQLSDEELNPRETGAPCRSKSCEQGRLLPWASGGLPRRELGPPSHPGARTSCEAGMTTGRECGRGRACHDRTPPPVSRPERVTAFRPAATAFPQPQSNLWCRQAEGAPEPPPVSLATRLHLRH